MSDQEQVGVLEAERRRQAELRERGDPDPARESAQKLAEAIKSATPGIPREGGAR